MKKIWIRKSINTASKIITAFIFIIVILIVWLILTTIRQPIGFIKTFDFENLIINRLQSETDKTLLTQHYIKDEKENRYRLIQPLNNKEKIMVREAIASTGYLYQNDLPNPIFSPNVLPHPLDIIKSFPALVKGTSEAGSGFQWKRSLFYAVWISLRRELIAFLLVILLALPLGVLMSTNNYWRSFFIPALVVGSFIPIAALIPLTMAFFGIGEEQKIIFLGLGMFFVLLGLVMKEIDEVDEIFLNTGYTLGFTQLKTILFIIVPTALPRIWKHFAAIFGLGWGYIIFAEMINSGGEDVINGIGWLFIARQRRFKVPEMYAIFFVIIFFAFFFSYLFKMVSYILFKHERGLQQ